MRRRTSKNEVTIFTYTIEHDLGFAPNPFHRVCTLACCKPAIRKAAKEGDYIIGMGAVKPNLRGHISYWMRVNEILSFDQYWKDHRFRRKKPVMSGTTFLRYGDNIYHRDGGEEFIQENSFHSLEDGAPSLGDLKRDTARTEKVLIGHEFAYWGKSGLKLPEEMRCFAISGPGHWSNFSADQVGLFFEWLAAHPERGFIDEPAHWQFLNKKRKPAKK